MIFKIKLKQGLPVVLLILAQLSLSACGLEIRRQNSNSSDPENPPISAKNIFEANAGDNGENGLGRAIESRILSQSIAGGVNVQITIHPDRLVEKHSYVLRHSRDSADTFLRFIDWRETQGSYQFLDRNLRSGILYTYALVAAPENYVIHPSLSVKILSPLNLELGPDQVIRLAEIAQKFPDCYSQAGGVHRLEFGRLFLAPGSRLLGDGLDWWLKFDRLESDDGKIASFERGQLAPRGMPGRSSGKIFLDIVSGHGSIQFSSRGENGGWGYNGFPGFNGKPGRAGMPSVLSTEIDDEPIFKRKICIRAASWGPIGTVGSPGTSGTDGRRGGSSESFSLRFQRNQKSDLDIQFESTGGLGGRGGVGGPGGRGGARVLGSNDPSCLAPPASLPIRARPGRNGQSGRDGLPGASGALLCTANSDGLFRPNCFDPR
jgi:hypothetical protein